VTPIAWTLEFRFRTGSSELDNKALRDLDRMADLLSNEPYRGKYLVLWDSRTASAELRKTLPFRRTVPMPSRSNWSRAASNLPS
jgi:hypothetical protein